MDSMTSVKPSFQLKGSLFTLSVLQLRNSDLKQLSHELKEKTKLAPKFFHYAPVVIDLSKLDDTQALDFIALNETLREHKLIPVGIRGAETALQSLAQQAGFAIMLEPSQPQKEEPNLAAGKTTPKAEPKADQDLKEVAAPTLAKPTQNKTMLITQPIRSGQQVYAQGADLIVVSSVSPGAELLADGNIHVYGTLRGRALAGINGNEKARIFCHKLEAELVAISGHYKVFEDLNSDADDFYKQLYLEDGQLIISSL